MDQLIIRLAIRNMSDAGKIACIKFVRALTYMGLKEAKDLVEEIAAEYNIVWHVSDWELELTERNKTLLAANQQLAAELLNLKDQLKRIIEG